MAKAICIKHGRSYEGKVCPGCRDEREIDRLMEMPLCDLSEEELQRVVAWHRKMEDRFKRAKAV